MSSHLECINEDYVTHLVNGLSYSSISLYASMVFFVHAIVPEVLISEGSDTIFSLSRHLYKRANKLKQNTYGVRAYEEQTYEEKMDIV